MVVNLFINPSGIPGRGKPADLEIEHQIREVKNLMKDGQTLERVKNLSFLGPKFAGIRKKWKDFLETSSTSSHKKPERRGEIEAIKELLLDANFLKGQGSWTSPFVRGFEKDREKRGFGAEGEGDEMEIERREEEEELPEF